jgi:hypothetical protein
MGYVWRRNGLEHAITMGKINGKRDRGRQREKMLDRLTVWHKKKINSGYIK